MSKELDYLDKILNYQPLTLVERTINDCIKEKIQRLEAIDNANPSEALGKLRELRAKPLNWDTLIKVLDEVEQALLKTQEQEKLIEIIKNKRVLIECLLEANTLEDYNCQVMSWNKLTQEEFNLLKELLKNES